MAKAQPQRTRGGQGLDTERGQEKRFPGPSFFGAKNTFSRHLFKRWLGNGQEEDKAWTQSPATEDKRRTRPGPAKACGGGNPGLTGKARIWGWGAGSVRPPIRHAATNKDQKKLEDVSKDKAWTQSTEPSHRVQGRGQEKRFPGPSQRWPEIAVLVPKTPCPGNLFKGTPWPHSYHSQLMAFLLVSESGRARRRGASEVAM